jgi:hypothetical protein
MKTDELQKKSGKLKTGNVFKDLLGNSVTSRISQNKISKTLKFLHKITELPIKNHLLGSAGKKESSGDLDILVDSKTISKSDLENKLGKWVHTNYPTDNLDQWIKKSGISVHFRCPIEGDVKNEFCQVDFMFHDDPTWMKFSMYSPGDASKYSGADRNLLMSSIAKAKGVKYSWQKGLIDREDQSKTISKNPDKIAQLLLGADYDHHVFDSVEQIQLAIRKNQSLMEKLQRLIVTLCDSTGVAGIPKKPGEIRVDNEEADRIMRLTGLKGDYEK